MIKSQVEYWVEGRLENSPGWSRIYVDDKTGGWFRSLEEARVGLAEFLVGERRTSYADVRLTRLTFQHDLLCSRQSVQADKKTRRNLTQYLNSTNQ
jgi:hypothetical protein